MKIVVADDEVLVRKGICMSIDWQKLGIDEVFEASDGERALNIIMDNPIDILITDIKMPKMNGLELLNRVCTVSPDTVCLVLSCVNDMECVREAMKFNKALDYIPKLTMNTDELESVIRRTIKFVKGGSSETRKPEKLEPFFCAEQESELRHIIEYGSEIELEELLEEIFNGARFLGDCWRDSNEWEEIAGVFISVGKRYGIYEKEFLIKKLFELKKIAETLETFEKRTINLFLQMKEKIEEEKRKGYDTGIQIAVEYMERNYMKNLKLGEVAEVSGMSESYFSRYFKKMLGEGFSNYLNRIRVEKAKELMAKKKMSMQEVAEQVGYSNSAYFTQIFKGITGVLPKTYQKQFFE